MTWLLMPILIAAPFLVIAARLLRSWAIRRRCARVKRGQWGNP